MRSLLAPISSNVVMHIVCVLKKWDYLFDVTTEDGRVLKLPYNVGEDPNWAARRFVEKNNLPIQFVHKVNHHSNSLSRVNAVFVLVVSTSRKIPCVPFLVLVPIPSAFLPRSVVR